MNGGLLTAYCLLQGAAVTLVRPARIYRAGGAARLRSSATPLAAGWRVGRLRSSATPLAAG